MNQPQLNLGFGGIIAIILIVLDAALAFMGKPPGGPEVAIFIGALAVARLT